MKIAIDATAIPKEKAGVGKYLINLLKELAVIDKKNFYYIFIQSDDVDSFKFANSNFHTIPVNNKLMRRVAIRLLWEQFVLPVKLKQLQIDCLHSPHYTMPFLTRVPVVVNFHDMAFHLFPELYSFDKRKLFPLYMKLSAKRARRILAISQSTAKDISNILGVPGEKIIVTLIGRDGIFRPIHDSKEITQTLDKYKIKQPYILFVGTLEPRKNILALLKAFQILSNNELKGYRLVLAGKPGWFYQEIFDFVKAHNMQEDVIFTGYLADSDLPYLYNGARLFVYPSLYEGFGIPVLEALSCGIPTITSNVSSMPEVAGLAGITVDSSKPENLAVAIRQVLQDNELYDKMRVNSVRQAEKFSWKACAEKTLQVYETIEKQ